MKNNRARTNTTFAIIPPLASQGKQGGLDETGKGCQYHKTKLGGPSVAHFYEQAGGHNTCLFCLMADYSK